MELKLEQLIEHLKRTRDIHGVGAYRQAVDALGRQIAGTDQGMSFLTQIADALGDKDLNLDQLKEEAEATAKLRDEVHTQAQPQSNDKEGDQDLFIKALQQQMPNLTTQAHFDVAQAAFQAVQLCLNSYFGGDHNEAEKARAGLDQTLDMAEKLKDIEAKIEDNPEATTNQDFTAPPREFRQDDAVDQLLAEVEALESSEKLGEWYALNKDALAGVTNQQNRNSVYDAIRKKKKALAN